MTEIPPTWTFHSAQVASTFDTHVREQLPWYDMVTEALVQIGRHYIGQHGVVYDLGAANGNVARALEPILAQRHARITSIEPSLRMVDTFKGPGEVLVKPAQDVAYEAYDLAVAMLTLMFVPPREVAGLLAKLVAAIAPGGALVVVERMLPPPGYPAVVTSRLTLAAKAAMGAPPDQIVAKELSLAGVQRPLCPTLLAQYGAVEWFRYGDFAGYLIESSHAP